MNDDPMNGHRDMTPDDRVQITIRVPHELAARLDACAARDRRSRNGQATVLLERGIEVMEEEPAGAG